MLFSRKFAIHLAIMIAVFYGVVIPFSHRVYETGTNTATLFVIQYFVRSVLLGFGLLWFNCWRLVGLCWMLFGVVVDRQTHDLCQGDGNRSYLCCDLAGE